MTNDQPQRQGQQPATNGFGVASLVLGVVGLLISFIPFIGVIALPMVILGIVFGGVAINAAKKTTGAPLGMPVAGLACSVVGLVICLAVLA